MIRQRSPGRWEVRITNKLLTRPHYKTCVSRFDAEQYAAQIESLLAQGVVPVELYEQPVRESAITVGRVIREFLASVAVPPSDAKILSLLEASIGGERIASWTYQRVEAWVRQFKIEANLAPGTIRKRVGALARCFDWVLQRYPGRLAANPLRSLPKRYSAYTEKESSELKKTGRSIRVDISRDRRLADGEEAEILRCIDGHKRPDRERPLDMPERDHFRALFLLIINTGLRLREAYSLRAWQIDLDKKTINVGESKRKKGRQVPITPGVYPALVFLKDGKGDDDLVFPWWPGDRKDLDRVTSRLSRAFARLFEYANCKDLTEHDLRHEATCRWVLLKDRRGNWIYRDNEICKIMGWSDPRQMLRYASLRGSDLSNRLWQDES